MKLSKKGEARHSQQHPFQSLLPFPVAGEGHHCSHRSRSSAVAPAEVLPDMSYYISDTILISSDPFVPLFVSAIALHKIPEGLATGVSFGTGVTGDVLTVAGAISIQNIPEAVVIVAPLFAIGVTSRRVIGLSLAIAAISMVSVLLGALLVSVFASLLPFVLAAAGGAMLYVISDEMIPETHSHGFEKGATFALLAGFLLVMILQRMMEGL